METGDRVIIRKGNAWEGEVGTFRGIEQTLVGPLHRVELDNGFAVLVLRTAVRVIDD